jgi:hypothetical protein
MDKRRLHHLWTKVRWIKPWYFLLLAGLSAFICVIALRANNQHMVQLRKAVYVTDERGGDVQGALRELQSYVTSHMNTDLTVANSVYPPIQLKYTYERLQAAQNDKFTKNNDLYTEAQKACEAQNSRDVSGRNRVPCIEQYVLSHTTAKPPQIPDALYKFSFVSPTWSPDLAGWSMLAAILFLLLGVVSSMVWLVANRRL